MHLGTRGQLPSFFAGKDKKGIPPPSKKRGLGPKIGQFALWEGFEIF